MFEGSILAGSAEQEQLAETYILPYQEEILSDMSVFRDRADARILAEEKQNGSGYTSPYPVGRCREITKYVYNSIIESIDDPSLQGVKAIRKFVKEGGTCRIVWTIRNRKHFQNAIQIGPHVVDVAEDTVKDSDSKISFHLNPTESGYETVESIEQFAEMAEKSWGYRAYPNIYLPALAPLYPVIFRKKLYSAKKPNQQYDRDGIYIDGNTKAIFNINLALHEEGGYFFGPTHDFLFRSKYAQRRLPPEAYEGLLRNEYLQFLHKQTGKKFFVSDDPDKAREYLQACYHMGEDNLPEVDDNIRGMIAVGKKLDGVNLATIPHSAKDNEQMAEEV